MTRASPGSEEESVDALLTDAEGVEAPTSELERGAAALVDDEVAADGLGVLGAEPLRTGAGSHLLVGGEDQLQRAALGAPARLGERNRRGDLGCDLPLHVLCAAAADLVVDDVAGPRAEAPLRGVGRNGVDVAEHRQRRAVALAREVGNEVRASRLG